jgi:nucleotide-binding universal stress UspA family protein
VTRQQGGPRRIVAGVDGSPSSQEALRWAVRQAELTGAEVEAVIAWRKPLLAGGYVWPAFEELEPPDFATIAGQILSQAVTSAVDPDGPAQISQVVKEGNPAQVLIDETDGAELLVVGSRGHGGFTEALLGSVSQHCVHHAQCPVVIIRGEGQPA